MLNQRPPVRSPADQRRRCTNNCSQDRLCTCNPSGYITTARKQPSKRTLLARLRVWWRLRPLRAELAGLEDDHATVEQQRRDAQSAKLGGDATAQVLAEATQQLRQIELADITKRTAAMRARIAAIEAAP
jgi:hypothetical protein